MDKRQKETSIPVGRTTDNPLPPSSTPSTSPPSSYPTAGPPPPPTSMNYRAAPYVTAVPAPSTWSFSTGTVFRPAEYFAQTEMVEPKKKSLLEAYMLAVPLGWLGAHHFYLGRPGFGVLYFCTLGLFGAGYLVDLVRMPCLVSQVNKRSRERAQQLAQLQQQQQLQEQRTTTVFMVHEPRYLADAYILWFPLGLFGVHHFYLRNNGMGLLYMFTVGLFGIGWLVDAFRMPSLVKKANECDTQIEKNQCTAHILLLFPFTGIMGGHHYYLNRPVWGALYTFTLGLMGVGWVFDLCRVNVLVRRANAVIRGEASPSKKYLDDAYVLCFPWGFTGLHHFYLGRIGWGFLYFFTFGLVGIGWIVDLFRLPCLVKEINERQDETRKRLVTVTSGGTGGAFGVGQEHYNSQGGYTNQGFPTTGTTTVVVSSHQPGTSHPHPPTHNGTGPVAAGYNGYPGYQGAYQAGYQAGYPVTGVSYNGPYPSYAAMAPHYTMGNTAATGVTAPYPPPPSYEASLEPPAEPSNHQQPGQDMQKRPPE